MLAGAGRQVDPCSDLTYLSNEARQLGPRTDLQPKSVRDAPASHKLAEPSFTRIFGKVLSGEEFSPHYLGFAVSRLKPSLTLIKLTYCADSNRLLRLILKRSDDRALELLVIPPKQDAAIQTSLPRICSVSLPLKYESKATEVRRLRAVALTYALLRTPASLCAAWASIRPFACNARGHGYMGGAIELDVSCSLSQMTKDYQSD